MNIYKISYLIHIIKTFKIAVCYEKKTIYEIITLFIGKKYIFSILSSVILTPTHMHM